MKNKLLLIFIMIASISLGLDNNSLYAFQYKGEMTWSYHRTQTATGSTSQYYTIKGALSYVAGSYYIFQGRMDVPGEQSLILSGSAILEGSNLMVTMNGAEPFSNGMNQVIICYATVDKTTFNGTVWGNMMYFNTGNRIMSYDYSAGTLTCTSTPIPLTPSTTAPQINLLMED